MPNGTPSTIAIRIPCQSDKVVIIRIILRRSNMTSNRPNLSKRDSQRSLLQAASNRTITKGNTTRRLIQEVPRTAAERNTREKQRIQEYEERKAERKDRLKSVTNQWADNRLENSSLRQPRRASWMRTDDLKDLEVQKSSYMCCGCFG